MEDRKHIADRAVGGAMAVVIRVAIQVGAAALLEVTGEVRGGGKPLEVATVIAARQMQVTGGQAKAGDQRQERQPTACPRSPEAPHPPSLHRLL
ncbi:MAG: hypothetical protein R3D33_13020 [Hyphomicrobiaceae bacterium]